MDLLALENAQAKLVGGTSGRRISDTLYFTGVSASGTVAGLSLTQNSQAVLDASTSFAGDVSGAYGALTVTALQGNDVLAGTPTDGDVLTWVTANTRWEPVAPAGGSSYYTVLDSTATNANMTDALNNYDVVYLKPGVYSNITTTITVPNNKQLIGLSGGVGSSSTYMPQITLDTTTAYVTLGYNALVEGIRFVFSLTTGGSFLRSTTDYNSRIRWCSFIGSGAGTTAYALSGSFKEISHVYMTACFGINVGYNQTSYGGTTHINNIWWSGHTTDTSIANVGLNITALATGSKLKVNDCYFYGGVRAVYNALGSYCNFSNIVCDTQSLSSTYSFYNTGANNTFSNIHIRLANTGTVNGFYSEGSYNTYSGIYVHDAAKIGINFSGGSHCVADAVYAYDCGDTATVQSGITFANNSYWVVGDMGSYGSGSHGVSISAVTHSTFGTIQATGNGGDGVNISGATHDCTFGTIQANNNTGDGVEVNGTTFYSLHFAGGTTLNNGAYGLLGGNGTTPTSRLDAWMAVGNSSGQVSLGTNWVDYSTPVPAPTSPSKHSVVRYSGTAWAASRDYAITKASAVDSQAAGGNKDVLSYTPAASELADAGTTIKFLVEIYNASGATFTLTFLHGANTICAYSDVTANSDMIEAFTWQRPGGATTDGQYSSRGSIGSEVGTTTFVAGGLSGATALKVNLAVSGSGTVNVRAYVIEIRKE
jgi:hypothetical protein